MKLDIQHRFQTMHEIIKEARLRLNQFDWDYLAGGTESETTLKRNRQALDSVAFRPRALRDVSNISSRSSLFGREMRLPVFMAPIGAIETFVEGGAATAAKASAAFGVPQMLSSVCHPGLEGVAEAADNFRIFQLYVRGDGPWTDEWVKKAVDHGYAAFCLTVDTAVYSRRERDIAKRHERTWRILATGTTYQAALNWDDVKRFKDKHDIPLVIKGIATAEDARLCVEHGVDCVYVSNHGGRQLDHGRGALDVLPEVVKAVAGACPVVVDGGFMRGTDVVKAIALGATAVGIGRLTCMGLAAAGEEGLVRALELLEDEVQRCMGLLGVTSLADLNTDYLHAATPVVAPHLTSAYPLMDLKDEGY